MSMTAVPVARQDDVEQAELGVQIGLDRRVVVHVVAAEVGEGGGLDAQAVDAALVEALARGFDARRG